MTNDQVVNGLIQALKERAEAAEVEVLALRAERDDLLSQLREEQNQHHWTRSYLKGAEGERDQLRGDYELGRCELASITDLVGNRAEAGTYMQVEGKLRELEVERDWLHQALTVGVGLLEFELETPTDIWATHIENIVRVLRAALQPVAPAPHYETAEAEALRSRAYILASKPPTDESS